MPLVGVTGPPHVPVACEKLVRSCVPQFVRLPSSGKMARGSLVLGAGATALLASSQLSQPFAAPRTALQSQVALGQGHGHGTAQGSARGEPQGALAAGGVAMAAMGLAAQRRKGASRVEAGRQVCATAAVGKKRCLVMGGTRFIGCYLVAKLREQGHEVVLCNRGKTNGGKPERLPGAACI